LPLRRGAELRRLKRQILQRQKTVLAHVAQQRELGRSRLEDERVRNPHRFGYNGGRVDVQVPVDQISGFVNVASLMRQRDQVPDRGREPRIEIEHSGERALGLAHRFVEQPGEMKVELAEDVPRLWVLGRLGGSPFESVERREAVALDEQPPEPVEQQAVGRGESTLVDHGSAQGGAEALLRGIHLRGDEGES
jgi:hypothetical protein